MTAVAPVTLSSVPSPPVGGSADVAAQSAPAPVSTPARQAPAPVLSTSDAAKVILAQPPQGAALSEAIAAYNPPPSALQIQSALDTVLLNLDNLPEEHPNAPATVTLQNQESTLRVALEQVLLGTPGPVLASISGVLLNAAA